MAACVYDSCRIVPYLVLLFPAGPADDGCLLEPVLYRVERLLGFPPLAGTWRVFKDALFAVSSMHCPVTGTHVPLFRKENTRSSRFK